MTNDTGPAAQQLDTMNFRHVVGHLASGVTVITTEVDGVRYGMTASSVTSLSADPPMMLVCLNNAVPTAEAVGRSGRYAINVLDVNQGALAQRFAVPSDDKFAGVPTLTGSTGSPLLTEALAHLECEVVERVTGGTHSIFLGAVVGAAAHAGEPLTYFRGDFGRFEFARNDEVYRHARDQVLDRVYGAGDVIELDRLAAALEVDEAAAFYALTRLAADGLIVRDPNRGYTVAAFDARTSDATFDARLAIEVGVIDNVVGKVPVAELEDLRERFEEMAAQLVDDRFVDFDAYLDANYRFHERLVSLAGNPLLTATFGSLQIKQVMARTFGSTPESSQLFVEVQRRIVEAFEDGDRDAAVAAVQAYSEMAKERTRVILAGAGGRL